MAVIELPSGNQIDFGDADPETIQNALKKMKKEKPELFEVKEEVVEESSPVFASDVIARANKRRANQQQAREVQGPPLTHPELEVADAGFQYFYGQADNDAERAKRLVSVFGEEGIEKRGQNNFILNLDNIEATIKDKYDLPDSGTMQVNRKGFSRYDLARFGGEYRGPLLTTLAAGLATTGVGILPAMGIMGVAGAAGKGIDEYLEHLEGFQLQSKTDVYKDMSIEAAYMAGGEGLFRGLFYLGGRIVRGPGPKPSEARVEELVEAGLSPRKAVSYATEEARVLVNKQVKAGARPNVEEATGKAFLGRMQAIYEAIIPNRKAARANSDYVKNIMRQVSKGELTKEQAQQALNDQATSISNLIKENMADPDEAIRIANRHLFDVIEQEFKEINKVITKNLKNEKGSGEITGAFAQDFATALGDAARLFKQDSAILYENANKALRNQAIFDGAPLVKGITKLNEDVFKVASNQGIVGTPLIRFLNQKLKGSAQTVDGAAIPQKFTLTELNSLRSVLNAEKNNPMLIGTQAERDASILIKNIDEMLANQENVLGTAMSKVAGTQGGVGVKGTQGFQSPAKIEEMRNSFNLLSEANEHYMKGKALFNSEAAELIIKNVEGKNWVDLAEVSNYIIKAGRPEKLRMFLDVITPSTKQLGKIQKTDPKVFKSLEELAANGRVTEFNALIEAEGLSKAIPKIPAWVGTMKTKVPDDPSVARILQQNVDAMKQMGADVIDRTASEVKRDRLRDMLANQWMRETLRQSIGDTGTTNYGNFAVKFKQLDSSTAKLLFGDNYNRLNSVANDALVVNKLKGNITDIGAIDDTLYLPAVRQEIDKVQNVIRQAKQEGENAFLKTIRTGKIDDMETLVDGILLKPGNFKTVIDRVTAFQGKEIADQTSESIKDMVMAKIVNTSFPDGITPQGIATGSFGETMEATIKQMNKNKSLENILGSKEIVNNLTKISQDAARVSNRAFKGKAGLAPAVFIASAGYRALTAPLSFATELASIVGLGKLLRSRRVLNFFTNPRMRSRQMKEGIRFGADMGQDIVPIGARQRREFITQQGRKLPGYGIRESYEAVDDNIPEEVRQGVNQGIGQGRDVLREVEINKLLGVQ